MSRCAVSTTGVATPSLDALVIERLDLRRNVRRLPIFGLGCAGGVVGLARAAELAQAHPGSRVLFLVVELCALTFRKDDISKSNIVATALFGDGAAGAILSTEGNGAVIGAGAVGLACGYALACRGLEIAVLESAPESMSTPAWWRWP